VGDITSVVDGGGGDITSNCHYCTVRRILWMETGGGGVVSGYITREIITKLNSYDMNSY
jgi:hypothetical protein